MAAAKAKSRSGRWWLAAAVALVLLWAVTHHDSGSGSPTASASGAATQSPSTGGSPSPSPSPSATGWYTGSYDPAQFAAQVRTRSKEAGVDPQLVMAVLYNEAYKPHDPAVERAWQKLKPSAAFGIANMHEATFDETKEGRPFADRQWTQLPDDPDLAIEAEAWYLHDLATQLPSHLSGGLTKDELLALGYNTGPGNMLLFAEGVKLGPSAQSYLDELRSNWAKAGTALAS